MTGINMTGAPYRRLPLSALAMVNAVNYSFL